MRNRTCTISVRPRPASHARSYLCLPRVSATVIIVGSLWGHNESNRGQRTRIQKWLETVTPSIGLSTGVVYRKLVLSGAAILAVRRCFSQRSRSAVSCSPPPHPFAPWPESRAARAPALGPLLVAYRSCLVRVIVCATQHCRSRPEQPGNRGPFAGALDGSQASCAFISLPPWPLMPVPRVIARDAQVAQSQPAIVRVRSLIISPRPHSRPQVARAELGDAS